LHQHSVLDAFDRGGTLTIHKYTVSFPSRLPCLYQPIHVLFVFSSYIVSRLSGLRNTVR
jgi:hypothetical protein